MINEIFLAINFLIGIANESSEAADIGADRLWNDYGIRYESGRSHAGRTIKLTLDNSHA